MRLPERLGLGLLILGVGAPIAASLAFALLYSVGLTGLLSEGFTTDHWRAVLRSRETWAACGLSIYVALGTLLSTVGLALGLALGWRESLRRGALSYLAYVPLALPGTVAAFFTLQMLSGGGLLARALAAAGALEEPARLLPLVHDRLGVGIFCAHALSAVPFFTLLFVQLYDSERIAELRSLSLSLGARPVQTLWRVAVPVLLYRARTNLVLYFVVALGSFEIPLLLGRQAPQVLSVLTYRKFALFDLAERPQAFVVALLYTAVVMALLALVLGRRDA